jgi:thiol-disulfide isomerase/thioredoxin
MKANQLVVAAVLAIAIGAPIAGFIAEMKGQSMTSTGVRVPFLHGFPTGPIGSQTELASVERANEWLNSPPLTPSALRGKVVLIDFWTYTCINWRCTLPYVRAWAEKYRDQGLVTIRATARLPNSGYIN